MLGEVSWIGFDKNFTVPSLVYRNRKCAEFVNEKMGRKELIIPCTITYTLPKKIRRAKK